MQHSSQQQLQNQLKSIAEVGAVIGAAPSFIGLKQIDFLDEGCAALLAHARLAGFGYRDRAGAPHATFLGGPPGFVRVDDPRRFSFASTADVGPGGVSFLFLLPGVGETLRVNGTLLYARRGRVEVRVEEAFVHCGRCVLRAELWGPPAPLPLDVAPPAAGPLADATIARALAASPFLVLSTWDAAGHADTSPRGDPPGQLRVLDGHTLALPDRRGNRRADTLKNLMSCDALALAALVPGTDDVLMVRGTGVVTTDPDLLATIALGGKAPASALVVTVIDAAVQASDAVRAARPWEPAAHVDKQAVPDPMALGGKHIAHNRAKAAAAPPSFEKRLVDFATAHFGVVRALLDLSYRVNLVLEGYGKKDTSFVRLRRFFAHGGRR